MSKVAIGWSPRLTNSKTDIMDLLADKPDRVITRDLIAGNVKYCPAFNTFHKNTFAVKMPYTIVINKVGEQLSVSNSPKLISPAVNDKVKFEYDDTGVNCQIHLNNLFVSDTPKTMIETLPPTLHQCREEIQYLCGVYDCHAWQRPLHFGFRLSNEVLEQLNSDDCIIFEEGEVVMYVRFTTPNDDNVILKQFDEDDLDVVTKYVNRNLTITDHVRPFNLTSILNRVRNRRPKRFLRNKNYGD
jgi:hypothetical protein